MCAKYYIHCYNTRGRRAMTWFAHCVPVVRIFFSASSPLPRCSLTSISSSPSHFPTPSRARLSATCAVPIGTRLLLSPSKRGQTRFGSVARRRPRERRSTTLTGICDVTAVSSRNAIIRCVCVCRPSIVILSPE